MSQQALTVTPQQTGLASMPKEQVDLIRRTVFPKSTDDELAMYLHDCARQGIHPLDRLIHPTVRTDKNSGTRKYTPIISIDYMRMRAEEAGGYAGSDDPAFEGTPGAAGFTAKVTVWKMVEGQRCPFTATARWTEYKPQDDFMWRAKPHLMLGKCAEALALRKAFPRKLNKLYIGEEMEQAGAVIDVDPVERTPLPPQVTKAAKEYVERHAAGFVGADLKPLSDTPFDNGGSDDAPPPDLDAPRGERPGNGRPDPQKLAAAVEEAAQDVQKLEALWPQIERMPPGIEREDIAGAWLLRRFALVKRGQDKDYGATAKRAKDTGVWLGEKNVEKRAMLAAAARAAKAESEQK